MSATIAPTWYDIWGVEHVVPDAALAALARAFDDPGDATARCFLPEWLRGGGRGWGIAVQLYGVVSERNWGIGDFGDLATIVRDAASAGADFVGLNPLHALFTANPAHDSPYSPSSRAHCNPLYLDVQALPEFAECDAARAMVASNAFAQHLRALRAAPLVDYRGVWTAKREILTLLHAHFRERHLAGGSAYAAEYIAFVRARGESLERFATFEALDVRFRADAPWGWGWRAWPAAFHDPMGQGVARFAAEHPEAIDFHRYLQWHIDRQLGACARAARESGMRIGLYLDLAVGVDPNGADVWAARERFAEGVAVGAPPDELQLLGQNWGLPPWKPTRLRAAAYGPFAEVLRANMRHAGALRLDHVMGLERLYVVPDGVPATDGAYVAYDLDAMIATLARESAASGCVVIGEDLGTVSDTVRQAMRRADVLGLRPFIFGKDASGAFTPPQAYPGSAMAVFTTHDLPTVAGFWAGRDLAVRDALGLYATDEMSRREHARRAIDRERMLEALQRAGLDASSARVESNEVSAAFAAAIHRFIARTPSPLVAVQSEDLLGLAEQTNVPGSVSPAHPNWQRKLPAPVERWFAGSPGREIVDALGAERPRR